MEYTIKLKIVIEIPETIEPELFKEKIEDEIEGRLYQLFAVRNIVKLKD